jgi:hypothetical protein
MVDKTMLRRREMIRIKKRLCYVLAFLLIFFLIKRLFFSGEEHISEEESKSLEIHSNKVYKFDPYANYLAFFHIEKTSGTNFDQEILRYLLLFKKSEHKWQPACELPIMKIMSIEEFQRSAIDFKEGRHQCKADEDSKNWYLSHVSEAKFESKCQIKKKNYP